jgi:hypothetical protein
LIGGTLLFWLLTAFPVRWLGGGDAALIYSATAVAVCLAPAVLTFLWMELATFSPEQKLVAGLGGTGLRIAFVLGALFLLGRYVPYYRQHEGFWIWVLVVYMVTLILEITLLASAPPQLAQRARESTSN